MSENTSAVTAPVVKAATVWAAVGITSWADFASFLAAGYSLLLIGEWCWKKFLRARAVQLGWIKEVS